MTYRKINGLIRRLRKRCPACWGVRNPEHCCDECQERDEASRCIDKLLRSGM